MKERGVELAQLLVGREKRTILQAIIVLLGMANIFQIFFFNYDWGALSGGFFVAVVALMIGGVLSLKIPDS